jgi:hypothetical protein
MRQISLWRHVIVGTILALSFSYAHAATANARIKGTVTDPTGAVVPKAAVTATNTDTGVVTTTTASESGDYIFQALPIGTYSITVNASGFKAFTATGIVLNIDQEFVEPVKLSLGSSSDTVSVEANSVQVNLTDMQLSNIVNSTEMVELPLIGRNFAQLQLILPGVQASSDRFGGFSVNGGQTQQTEFLINGADSNDLPLNTQLYTPNLDALSQFVLVKGPLNAEYDRNSGGIVSTTIKNGTNHFHGNAFEFYRDTFLNTANYFQYNTKLGHKTVSPFHQNIFGGTIGGPILKDKLFIFGAYQGIRGRTPQTGGNVKVPTSAQLAGNFSGTTFSKNIIPASLTSITGPNCTPGVNTYVQCFGPAGTNGQVPVTAFNSVSSNLVKTFVPPAQDQSTGAFVFNPITTTLQNQFIGRIDFNLNSKNQFTFVGIYNNQPTSDTLPFTGATIPGFGDTNQSHVNQYTFQYTRQLSATAVNEFGVHYTRFNYAAVTPQHVVDPASLGFAITPQNKTYESVPVVAIPGFFTLGFSSNGPQPRIDQVYQIDDNVSKAFGHHNFKFGYDGRRYNVSNPFFSSLSGTFNFSSSSSNKSSSGNALLDFLIGAPSSYAQGSGANIIAQAFLNYLFAQDTWKMSDSFTLSYGLGYQIDTPLHNFQFGGVGVTCYIPGQQSKIFPTAQKNLNFPGDPGCNNASGATTRYTDFGPRIGFAWAPDLGLLSGGNSKKLSIRGGYGIYYNRSEEETSLQNLSDPPFGLTSAGAVDYGAARPQFANPFLDLNVAGPQPNNKNRFPAVFPKAGDTTVDFSAFTPYSLSQYAPGFRSPYSENVQLTLEREFPSQVVAKISYVGSFGRHNQATVEGNPITPAGHAACLSDAKCIAGAPTQNFNYPTHTQFGYSDGGFNDFMSIGLVSTVSASNYNSFQAEFEKGMTHGLFLQASYTFSHALDNASNFENSGFGSAGARGYNQYAPNLNYGNSLQDARHRFVLAPIYRVPFRNGGNPFNMYNLLAAGWEISGISTLATGFPYDISYGGFGSSNSLWCSANTSYYACPDSPNQLAPLVTQNPRTPAGVGLRTNWFNGDSSHFADETVGQFGTASRNHYHGPGLNNTNVVVAKNIPFSSDGVRYIQLRLESDNVFNHTQFANPDGNFGNGTPAQGGTFGTIGSINTTTAARQTQIAAKIYF